ncbi:hypothetical protein [Pseudomonas sp. EL_65y_Pfl2_R95]|uniref:hypothetical protein n=1 Tax=Pseudomonas sp. EL_65y_Pfl2_R95 TaxID=3088698 RepID=UPI0030D7477F
MNKFWLLTSLLLMSACGVGETAATASLQAQQAEKAQQQMVQMQKQIDEANAANNQRLEQQLKDSN